MSDSGGVETGVFRRASNRYITGASVDGTVLVSGIIVAAGSHGASSIQVLSAVIGTVIVFWAAHVYAHTIAAHGSVPGEHPKLSTSFRSSLRNSNGFLTSAVLPSVVLLIGALHAIDDTVAIWIALWVGVAILAILGFVVFWLRGDSWRFRILGSLGTAAFGVAMILLKAIIH
jgi:hypothetical protein